MSEEKPETRTLGLSPRFLVSQDGRVFRRKDGTECASISISQAREKANGSPEFDRSHTTNNNATYAPSFGMAALVFEDEGERYARIVVTPNTQQRPPKCKPGEFECGEAYLCGDTIPAIGNTEQCWYFLSLGGVGNILFHGPSLAAQVWGHSRST